MGLGFTIALIVIGSIREIIGAGTWFGMQIIPKSVDPMLILILAPGGFFVFGVLMACANKIAEKKGKRTGKNLVVPVVRQQQAADRLRKEDVNNVSYRFSFNLFGSYSYE